MPNTIDEKDLEQIKNILLSAFKDGQQWIGSIGKQDWRRKLYRLTDSRGRGNEHEPAPPTAQILHSEYLLSTYLSLVPGDDSGAKHHYFVVRPESACNEGEGIALLRPVVKLNTGGIPMINFHVWFHTIDRANGRDHFLMGWRLEGSEGPGTTHDFYHAQPLRKYGPGDALEYGISSRVLGKISNVCRSPRKTTFSSVSPLSWSRVGRQFISERIRMSNQQEVRNSANEFLDSLTIS